MTLKYKAGCCLGESQNCPRKKVSVTHSCGKKPPYTGNFVATFGPLEALQSTKVQNVCAMRHSHILPLEALQSTKVQKARRLLRSLGGLVIYKGTKRSLPFPMVLSPFGGLVIYKGTKPDTIKMTPKQTFRGLVIYKDTKRDSR